MDATWCQPQKVIQNQAVVRQLDEVRQREMWQWAWTAVVLVVVLLVSAWQHWWVVQHGYAVEALEQVRASEDEDGRRLRVEIETLRAPQRIEQIATEDLHMVAPAPGQAIVIERIVTAERPSSSVVAAR